MNDGIMAFGTFKYRTIRNQKERDALVRIFTKNNAYKTQVLIPLQNVGKYSRYEIIVKETATD